MKKMLKNFSIRKKLITSHGVIAMLAVLCPRWRSAVSQDSSPTSPPFRRMP